MSVPVRVQPLRTARRLVLIGRSHATSAHVMVAWFLTIGWTQWTAQALDSSVAYCSDRHWSVAVGRARLAARVAFVAVACVLTVLAASRFLDLAIVLASLFMFMVTVTTLAFQLYKWWEPEHHDERPEHSGEPRLPDPPLPGVILVPMRHEEAVAEHTLERLATLNHPNYWVMPIVDHPDDPATARIAHAKARQHPDRVIVCRYPEDHPVHNKPIGLNTAVECLQELEIPFEWIGIADAEDVFHPDLLSTVDERFRATDAGIVQCGVQLMNFSTDPTHLPLPSGRFGRLRRWWQATSTGWWRAANVLEYFKWFQSRLKLQAALRVMPLGGNTVFFRREFLERLREHHGRYWDEHCLTEDCKIGITASVLGFKVEVVYRHELVTREETPATLPELVRQRVRWMQGFMQVFRAGEWLALPTRLQRVVAVYVLGFQFFQAASATLAPVALALALSHKSPIVVALLATVPLGVGLIGVALDVLMLHQFSRTFRARARLRDYVGVIVGAYPYQLVLSIAAAWAILRYALGRTNWVKTRHHGVHLRGNDVILGRPAPIPRPRYADSVVGSGPR